MHLERGLSVTGRRNLFLGKHPHRARFGIRASLGASLRACHNLTKALGSQQGLHHRHVFRDAGYLRTDVLNQGRLFSVVMNWAFGS